jgi:two-component system, chemotaxis family, sensor kinase Cph1
MAQLRNALRAQLFAGASPADALTELNAFSIHMVSRAFATVIAARVDPATGVVEAASAGHLMPYLTGSTPAVQAPVRLSPPVGIAGLTYHPSTFAIERGQGLVLYSDGLVERRHSTIDEGLERLAGVLGSAGSASAAEISTAMESGDADDDVTIVTLRRF